MQKGAKQMRTTQDDIRENKQLELFNLKALAGRSNKYIPDGTLEINNREVSVELKTSDVKRKQVSTARNLNLKKLSEYEKVWWIFSQYEKTSKGQVLTGEHYICHGTDLKPWLDKQEAKLRKGTKTYAGLDLIDEMKKLCEGKISKEDLLRVDNLFHKRAGLNDPKIGWKTVVELGTKVDNNNPSKHIREIISQRNPLLA